MPKPEAAPFDYIPDLVHDQRRAGPAVWLPGWWSPVNYSNKTKRINGARGLCSILGAQIDSCPAHWSKFIQCVRRLLYLHGVPLSSYTVYTLYTHTRIYNNMYGGKQKRAGAAMLERENPLCVEMA